MSLKRGMTAAIEPFENYLTKLLQPLADASSRTQRICARIQLLVGDRWGTGMGVVGQMADDGNGAPQAVADDTVSTRQLIEPIFTKTIYVAFVVSVLFVLLGASGILARFAEQTRWLIAGLAPVWPALPPQYEIVFRIRGPGHAVSFAFMSVALWMWPVVAAAAFLRAHAKRRESVLPISRKEKGQFLILLPIAVFFLLADTTPSDTFPLARFRADQWGFFYFRSVFLFTVTAAVLAILIYVIGRIVLERHWNRST